MLSKYINRLYIEYNTTIEKSLHPFPFGLNCPTLLSAENSPIGGNALETTNMSTVAAVQCYQLSQVAFSQLLTEITMPQMSTRLPVAIPDIPLQVNLKIALISNCTL